MAGRERDAVRRRRGGRTRWGLGQSLLIGGFPQPKPPFTLASWICELRRQIDCGLVYSTTIANWYRRWIAACEWELELERLLKRREGT